MRAEGELLAVERERHFDIGRYVIRGGEADHLMACKTEIGLEGDRSVSKGASE